MWRLFNPLNWFWGMVALAIALNIGSNLLSEPILPGVSTFLRINLWWELPFALMMAGFTLGAALSQRGKYRREETQRRWQQREWEHRERGERQKSLRPQFALLKDARDLRPEDFGFQVLSAGHPPSIEARPFYLAYIPRHIVPYHTATEMTSVSRYTEDTLAEMLRQGKGFVLIGHPLDGKSRTLYEILKGLPSRQVIGPLKSRPLPLDEAFRILEGQHVILLVEALNDYADSVLDLREFSVKLSHYTASSVIVATCRDVQTSLS